MKQGFICFCRSGGYVAHLYRAADWAWKLKLTGHEKARFLLRTFKNAGYENDENLVGDAGDGMRGGGLGARVDEDV